MIESSNSAVNMATQSQVYFAEMQYYKYLANEHVGDTAINIFDETTLR